MEPCSLRSKRFQSSYSAKVGAEAIKNGRGGGREKRKPSLPSPSPVISFFFFCSCPSLRSRRLEVVGTKKHLACLPRARPFSLSPANSKRLLRRLLLSQRSRRTRAESLATQARNPVKTKIAAQAGVCKCLLPFICFSYGVYLSVLVTCYAYRGNIVYNT